MTELEFIPWPKITRKNRTVVVSEKLDGTSAIVHVSGDGVLVIEWAEKIRDALPVERLWISFAHQGENARAIFFDALGERYEELLASLRAPKGRSNTCTALRTLQCRCLRIVWGLLRR